MFDFTQFEYTDINKTKKAFKSRFKWIYYNYYEIHKFFPYKKLKVLFHCEPNLVIFLR